MKTKLRHLIVALTLLSTIITQPSTASAQTTAFTYQGALNDGGSPANGSYDLRFALFDALAGGAQKGVTLTNTATAVSNGLFSVTLDFGNQFPGADRWLEMGVRTNGGGAFGVLTPRQPITPTPYSIYAGNAGSVPAASIGSGTANINISGNATTATSATTAGSATTATTANNFSGSLAGDVTGTQGATVASANLPRLNGTNVFTGTNTFNGVLLATNGNNQFTGNGGGLTNLTSTNLVGTIADARLSTNVALLNGTNVFTGTNRFAGVVVATNGNNQFTGTFTGNGAGVTNLNVNATNFNGVAKLTGGNTFNGTQIITNGNVGIGTPSPTRLLHLKGAGIGMRFEDTLVANSANNNYTIDTSAFDIGVLGFLKYESGSAVEAKSFFLNPSGNVGIGLRNPAARLDVRRDNAGGDVVAFGSQTYVMGRLGEDTANNSVYLANTYAGGTGVIDFRTPGNALGNTTMRILANGNVGIGTVAPEAKFHVYGNGAGEAGNVIVQNAAAGDAYTMLRLRNDAGSSDAVVYKNSSTRSADGGPNTMTVRNDAGDLRLQSAGSYGITIKTHNGNSTRIDSPNTLHIQANAGGALYLNPFAGGGDVIVGGGGAIGNFQVLGGEIFTSAINLTSDRNAKEEFKPVNPRAVLDKVARLPITEWQYKKDKAKDADAVRHIGPMAQDFHEAFALGHDDKHITSVDADGVALAAIQGLNEKVDEKAARIQQLEQTVAELKELVTKLARQQNGGAK